MSAKMRSDQKYPGNFNFYKPVIVREILQQKCTLRNVWYLSQSSAVFACQTLFLVQVVHSYFVPNQIRSYKRRLKAFLLKIEFPIHLAGTILILLAETCVFVKGLDW